MMEQTEAMKGFTELAMWSFLQPGNGQKADIGLLKEAVHELCQMTMQKTAGQSRPSGKGKYKEKDISWDNLERVKFQIICEAVLLVLSGKLDKLEDKPDDGIYETLHRRGEGVDMKVREISCLACGKTVAFDKRIHYAYCSEKCAKSSKRETIKKAYRELRKNRQWLEGMRAMRNNRQ